MRVLVTGADGFVGLHLLRCLSNRGHEPIAAVRDPAGSLRMEVGEVSISTVKLELTDEGSVRRALLSTEPEAVVHLAALSSVGRSWADPIQTMEVNGLGTLRLMRAIRDLPDPPRPRPVVLVSSGEVYGRSATAADPLREDDPVRPCSPYGASKATEEMVGWAYRGEEIRLVLTRSFPHTGPGQRLPFVIPDWTLQLIAIRDESREPVLDVGLLDVVRDFLDVRDVARAYVDLLERDTAEGVFNVSSGRGWKLREILRLLQDEVGVSVEAREDVSKLRPTDIISLVGSPERLRSEIGWRPESSLPSALRDLVLELERSRARAEGPTAEGRSR